MSPMTLKDAQHLFPAEALPLVELLEWVGQVLEAEADVSVTDLGYDFRAKRAELAFDSPGRGRLEMTLRRLES